MSEINLECCHLEGSHFSLLYTLLFIHYCFNKRCYTPHPSVIQDTHFLLTSTGWVGSTPTRSDLSSISLTLTSTFLYSILIRPIFTFQFFFYSSLCPLCPVFRHFPGSELFHPFKFSVPTLAYSHHEKKSIYIYIVGLFYDKIISWGSPEIRCDLMRKSSDTGSI